MQVEIGVEVDEQVEKLVRCTHFRRENDDKQQIGRVVLRTVVKARNMGDLSWWGW